MCKYFWTSMFIFAATITVGCGSSEEVSGPPDLEVANNNPELATATESSDEVTFNKHIAPLLYAHCAPCHRDGQVAPFSLLTFRDAASRAGQIADVTESGYMPPWKPDGGDEQFADARRLKPEEVATFRKWFSRKAPEGREQALPKPPEFVDGWLLGEPDLVLEMPDSYMLPAEGQDVFRSFVIPIPTEAVRYVRGLECRPSNAQVIHHADIVFDPTSQSRELDALDPEPGFIGMRPIEAATVGTLTGWAPGGTPILYPEEMAWSLDPTSDLVLTLHMLPTGKPEPVGFQLGFYFTEKRPKRESYLLRLASTNIDIPAGAAVHEVKDTYKLPVDVEAVGIRPHAHYLGKKVEVLATIPGGIQQTLLRINDWDFNWQDDYRYKKPMLLPKGTQLQLHWSFDNSAENVRNPNSPPQRVTWGAKSSDEMALGLLQVVPFNAADYRKLALDLQTKGFLDRLSGYESVIRREPDNIAAHNSLGYYYEIAPDKQAIAARLKAEKEASPDDPIVHYLLGLIRATMGEHEPSIEAFEAALANRKAFHVARYQLGRNLMEAGKSEESVVELEKVVQALPQSPNSHAALGMALKSVGRLEPAVESFKQSLQIAPKQAETHSQLGILYLELQDWANAEEQFRFLVESGTPTIEALANLSVAIQKQGRLDEAVDFMQQALELNSNSWQVHANLAMLQIARKDANQAIRHFQEALRIKPDALAVRMKFGELWLMVGEPRKAAEQFVEVSASSPEAADAHLKAAQTLKTIGEFDKSLKHYELATQARPNWMPAAVGKAWLLATHPSNKFRDVAESLRISGKFVKSKNPHPVALDTFAAACAANGDFKQAIQYALRATQTARAAGLSDLADRIQSRLENYEQGVPYREATGQRE